MCSMDSPENGSHCVHVSDRIANNGKTNYAKIFQDQLPYAYDTL